MGFFRAMEKPGQAPDIRLGPQGEASQACSLQLLGGVQPHTCVLCVESPLMSGAAEQWRILESKAVCFSRNSYRIEWDGWGADVNVP